MAELKYWDGTRWVTPNASYGLKYWTGAAWTKKVIKYATSSLTWQPPTFDRWATKTSMGYNKGIAVLPYETNGKLYVLTANQIQSYTQLTDTWATLTAPPVALTEYAAAAIVSNKIYCNLGQATTRIYNIDTDAWSTGAAFTGSGVRDATAGAIGTKIYYVGGANAGDTIVYNEAYVYDTVGDTWTAIAAPGIKRRFTVGGVISSKLYVCGGADFSQTLTGIQEYNPDTNSWQGKTPMPESFYSAAAGVVGSKLYVCGGLTFGGTTQDIVMAYDASTDAWTYRAPMPAAVRCRAGAALNGRVYVCGPWSPLGAQVYEYGT